MGIDTRKICDLYKQCYSKDDKLSNLEIGEILLVPKDKFLTFGYSYNEVPFSRESAIKKLRHLQSLTKSAAKIKSYKEAINIIMRIKEEGQEYI